MMRITPPRAATNQHAHSAAVPRKFQMGWLIGCHSQSSTIKAALLSRTYVLRSMGGGTIRVQNRLNPGRAIPLCCSPNRAIRMQSTMADDSGDQTPPKLIDFGTNQSQRNPAV